jgi:integrase
MARRVETSGSGQAKDCANLFRFLAFSGVRIDEVRHILWSDADFEKGLLHVRVTKNSKARWIPLNSSLGECPKKAWGAAGGIGRQTRDLCAKRGLDWDRLSEHERETFVDGLRREK